MTQASGAISAAGIEEADKLYFEQQLRSLVSFGPRLTGSASATKAIAWAVDAMRSAGLRQVHAEPWSLASGWERGTAQLEVLTPTPQPIDAVAYGWTGSTGGVLHGDLLTVQVTEDRSSASWRDKVLLVDLGSTADAISKAFFALPSLASTASAQGAIALLVPDLRAGGNTLHTGPLGFPGVTSRLPVLAITQDSAALLEGLSQESKKGQSRVTLSLAVGNTFIPHPFTANVVGELPGRTAGSDVVLVGAHLDSWDLSPGASDDAYGAALVLSLAKSFASRGRPFERTIRFVLFTGEEQGLLGSSAYLKAHWAERNRTALALVTDWGDGPITEVPLAGHAELSGQLQAVLRSADLANTVEVDPGYLRYTDAFSFSAAGLAGIAPLQNSPAYERRAHSAEDTLPNLDLTSVRFNLHVLGSLLEGAADPGQVTARRWSSLDRDTEMQRLALPSGLLQQWRFMEP